MKVNFPDIHGRFSTWPIKLHKKERHPSQDRDLSYWVRRVFRRWIYPHRVPVRFLKGVDDHYAQVHDWILEMVPDHKREIWLVLDRIGLDQHASPVFMQGEIRFRSLEFYTMFLLRFTVDTDQGYAII